MRRVSKEINNRDTRLNMRRRKSLKHVKMHLVLEWEERDTVVIAGLAEETWFGRFGYGWNVPLLQGYHVLVVIWKKEIKKKLYYNGRSCMALNLEFKFHFFPLYTGGFEPTIFYSSGFQHFVTIKAKEDVILFRSCHLSLSLISDICT